MMTKQGKLSKNEIKQATRSLIRTLFEAAKCEIHEKAAGSVNYEAVAIAGSDQRIAAIYGSRGGACALWVKDATWTRLKQIHGEDARDMRVQDVSMFARGFQWAIHFDGPDDQWIPSVIAATVTEGTARWEKALDRRATEKRRADERELREAKMAAKRRDPFA